MGLCQNTGSADYKVMVEPHTGNDPTNPPVWDTNSERYFPTSVTFKGVHEQITRDVMRGTPTLDVTDQVRGVTNVGGTLSLEPGRLELDPWLERVMGIRTTPTPPDYQYDVADPLPIFAVGQKIGGEEYQYEDCKCGSIVFAANQTENLTADVTIIGKDEVAWGDVSGPANPDFLTTWQSIPALSEPGTRAIQMAEGILNIGGTPYDFASFTLTIDNNLTGEHWNNRIVKCIEREADRLVTLEMVMPKNATTDNLYLMGDDGMSADITFTTSDSHTIKFTFGKLKWADAGPDVLGKGRIVRPLVARALGDISAGTPELVVTTDIA